MITRERRLGRTPCSSLLLVVTVTSFVGRRRFLCPCTLPRRERTCAGVLDREMPRWVCISEALSRHASAALGARLSKHRCKTQRLDAWPCLEVAFWSWGIRHCACRPSSSIHAEPLGSQHATGREQLCMWMVTGRSPFWLLRGVAIPEGNHLRPRHTGTGGIAILVSELSAVGLSCHANSPKVRRICGATQNPTGLGLACPTPGVSPASQTYEIRDPSVSAARPFFWHPTCFDDPNDQRLLGYESSVAKARTDWKIFFRGPRTSRTSRTSRSWFALLCSATIAADIGAHCGRDHRHVSIGTPSRFPILLPEW